MANKKEIEQDYAQLKFGLAFSKLLEKNKKIKIANDKKGVKDINLNHSLGTISSETGLRIATLSNIFSGKSNPKALTIDQILKALGKNLIDFARCYDKITDRDILEFKKTIEIKSRRRKDKITK